MIRLLEAPALQVNFSATTLPLKMLGMVPSPVDTSPCCTRVDETMFLVFKPFLSGQGISLAADAELYVRLPPVALLQSMSVAMEI